MYPVPIFAAIIIFKVMLRFFLSGGKKQVLFSVHKMFLRQSDR